MAQPNLPTTNGWITVPWSVYTGPGAGNEGMDAALGHGPSGNQTTFVIQVNWGDLQQAILDILGVYGRVSTFQGTSVINWVGRKPPVIHPLPAYQGFVANRITGIKPMKFLGKTTYGGVPGIVPGTAFPNYRFAVLTIVFTQPKYTMYDDPTLDSVAPPVTASDGFVYRQEWVRWLEWVPSTTIEALNREGGNNFKFVETAAGGPANNSPFASPWPQPLQKIDLRYIWHDVPLYNGLYNTTGSNSYRAANLESGLMCVNDAAFFNYPAGTVLFRGYRIQYNEAPYPPGILGLSLANGAYLPPLTADVEMDFQFFDPPAGTASNTTPGPNYNLGATTRGHNLAVFRDQKWYKVADIVNGTRTLFQSYPFPKLFSLST